MTGRTVLVAGGSSGIGLELAKDLVAGGDRVVLTSRSREKAEEVAAELGDGVTGIALDVSEPEGIADQLRSVGRLDGVVMVAIERDANSIREYDIARARRLVTLKLVGYAETVHTLLDRLEPSVDTGIVLFGGRAKDAPYPGSTTVSTINGGVDGLMNTLASSATARSGRRSPRACCTGTRAARPGARWRRWRTSSTPRSSCCSTGASPPTASTSTAAGASAEPRTATITRHD